MERVDAARIVRCPGCGGDSRYEVDNPFRPFCSRRCREADLGAWASERFRLPATPGTADPADEQSGES